LSGQSLDQKLSRTVSRKRQVGPPRGNTKGNARFVCKADRRCQGSPGQDQNCEGPKSHERRRYREWSASVPLGTTQTNLPSAIDRPGHAKVRTRVAERRDERKSATHDLRRSVTKKSDRRLDHLVIRRKAARVNVKTVPRSDGVIIYARTNTGARRRRKGRSGIVRTTATREPGIPGSARSNSAAWLENAEGTKTSREEFRKHLSITCRDATMISG